MSDENNEKKAGFSCPCPSRAEIQARLKRLWAGDVPLPETFWLYYIAVVFVLYFFGRILPPIHIVFDLLTLGWAAFMVKPIMTAAAKYAGARHWALLAKAVAIVIALGVIGQLLTF